MVNDIFKRISATKSILLNSDIKEEIGILLEKNPPKTWKKKKKKPIMFSRTPGVFSDIARILLVHCVNAKNQRDKTKALYKKQQESLIKHTVANHKSKKMV